MGGDYKYGAPTVDKLFCPPSFMLHSYRTRLTDPDERRVQAISPLPLAFSKVLFYLADRGGHSVEPFTDVADVPLVSRASYPLLAPLMRKATDGDTWRELNAWRWKESTTIEPGTWYFYNPLTKETRTEEEGLPPNEFCNWPVKRLRTR